LRKAVALPLIEDVMLHAVAKACSCSVAQSLVTTLLNTMKTK